MLKHQLALIPACALLTLACLGAAPVNAASPVTYVSGKGSDSNDCSSPAAPCRSFHRAVNQTAAGGEVKALDPADYFPVTINKSITITGVAGAGIVANGGTAIRIFGLPSTVNLANLLILNQNVRSSHSVGIGGGLRGSLTVKHCTVQGFETGVLISGTFGALEHVVVTSNTIGVKISSEPRVAEGTVAAVDTLAENKGTGFAVDGSGSNLSLAHSTVIENGVGINLSNGGAATSFGDNHIKGNLPTDVKGGTLTNVGTQ